MHWLAWAAITSASLTGVLASCGGTDAGGAAVGRGDPYDGADGASADGAHDDVTRKEVRAERQLPPGRPVATACAPTVRPATNAGADEEVDAGPDATNECALDDECTARSGGRCSELVQAIWWGGRSLGTRCTYDACSTDDDCGGGAVCGCAIGFTGHNVCLPQSQCRTDSHCAAGQVCALSRPTVLSPPGVIVDGTERLDGNGVPDESLGYFCTTPEDECRPGEEPPYPSLGCTYATDAHHWIWGYSP